MDLLAAGPSAWPLAWWFVFLVGLYACGWLLLKQVVLYALPSRWRLRINPQVAEEVPLAAAVARGFEQSTQALVPGQPPPANWLRQASATEADYLFTHGARVRVLLLGGTGCGKSTLLHDLVKCLHYNYGGAGVRGDGGLGMGRGTLFGVASHLGVARAPGEAIVARGVLAVYDPPGLVDLGGDQLKTFLNLAMARKSPRYGLDWNEPAQLMIALQDGLDLTSAQYEEVIANDRRLLAQGRKANAQLKYRLNQEELEREDPKKRPADVIVVVLRYGNALNIVQLPNGQREDAGGQADTVNNDNVLGALAKDLLHKVAEFHALSRASARLPVQVVVKAGGQLTEGQRRLVERAIQHELGQAGGHDGQGVAHVYFADSGNDPQAVPDHFTEQQVLLLVNRLLGAFGTTLQPGREGQQQGDRAAAQ